MAIVTGDLDTTIAADPAAAPAPTAAPTQDIPPELANNPMYMTPMRAPSGTVEDVAPHEIDRALALGYGTLNPDKLWEVRKPFQEPINVPGRDLQAMAKKGYRTNKIGEFQAQMEELGQATAPKMPEVSLPEKIFGGYVPAIASGATMGLSDVLTRGINELEGTFQGDPEYAKRNAEQLRTIRDSLGAGGIAAEIIGAVLPALLTGGSSLASLGKTATQRVGLSALEGIAGGIGSTAGRQALDDPTVTSQSYLWNAGIGAVLGGGIQSLSNVLTSRVAGKASQRVGAMELDLGNGVKNLMDSRIPATETLPIRMGDTLLGTVEVSRALDSAYHPGGVQGITLEAVNLAKGAPKGTEANLLHELVSMFGSVSSPSTVGALEDSRSLFSQYGTRHVTLDGNPWYQVTPGTLPDRVGQQSPLLTMGKMYMKAMGKYPDGSDKRAFEAVDNLFDPDKGIWRKEFLEYAADKDSKIATVVSSFRKADEYIKTYKKAAELAQKEIGERITPEGALAMKSSVNDAQRGILNTLTELDQLPSEAANVVSNKLVKTYDTLEKVIKAKDPKDAWVGLKMLRDDFKAEMKSTLPTATKQSSLVYPEQVIKAYKRTLGEIENALRNKAIMGEEGVELFTKLDDYAERLKATSREFDASFKSKIGGKEDLAVDKIQNSFDSTKPGRQLHRADVLDRFKAEAQGFMDTVKEAQSKGVARGIETPDPRLFAPMLSEINKARTMSETMRVIQTMTGGTGKSNFLVSMLASALPMTGFATGHPLVGMVAGQGISAAVKAAGDPIALLKLSNSVMQVETALTKIADSIAHAGTKALPVISRPALIGALGIKRPKDAKDPTQYIENVRDRLIQVSQPAVVAQMTSALPQAAQAPVAADLQRILKYALEQTPVVSSGRKLSHAEALKLDKVLLAVANPKMALTRAVVTNDADAIKHLKVMYPDLISKFQSVLISRMDGEKLTYNQKVTLQRISGINATGTSAGATKLAQSVFADTEESSAKGITGAPATTGAAIQAQ